MALLYQVWKRLVSYVRKIEEQEISNLTGLELEGVFTLVESNNAQNNYKELRSPEQLQQGLEEWTKTSDRLDFQTSDRQLDENIYELLGNTAFKIEIVETVMQRLIASNNFRPVLLFQRLADFYSRWCEGVFIDAVPSENLPQNKDVAVASTKSCDRTTTGRHQYRTECVDFTVGIASLCPTAR
ncbi:hypothetical protein NIES4106_30670 [Fischerella sp. NIES-4106]|nr:hypothetical protein NIES4106_30670 [Fischerella sp. NIES-4106]